MKKMKKIAATILCLGVAISTLCACSSTSNGVDQPFEETTTKQSEVVTETTETPTEQPIESETTEQPVPEGDVIIPLYDEYKDKEIHQILNSSFTEIDDMNNIFYFTNFSYYISHFYKTDRRVDDDTKFSNLYELGAGTTFEIIDPYTGVITPLEISFYCEIATERLIMYAEAPNGISMSKDDFVPLWYNQTQKYFVGYFRSENNGETSYRMCTYYWHNDNWMIGDLEGDPSLYGF